MLKPAQEIHKKIDAFINKYYRNALIKGAIVWLLAILGLYFLAVFSEFFGHFSISVRTTLFFALLSIVLILLYILLLQPFLSLLRIRKTIDNERVNLILSQHFPELKDQLKNVLELEDMWQEDELNDLIEASIEQKSKRVALFHFNQAVKIKENIKLLRWLLLPITLFCALYFYAPQVLSESTQRIINYNTYYEPQALFTIKIQNDSLKVKRAESFKLNIELDGAYYPQSVFVKMGGIKHLMYKQDANHFSFEFKSVYQDISFAFEADDYKSPLYHLEVLPDPKIINFTVSIVPPPYTGEKTQELKNNGDFTAPEGSRLQWNYKISQVDKIWMYSDKDTLFLKENIAQTEAQNIKHEIIAKQSFTYSLGLSNLHFTKASLFSYRAQIVQDEYPKVYLSAVEDSLKPSLFYFKGTAGDDYGLKHIYFCYKLGDKIEKIPLAIESKELPYEFYYSFDFLSLISSGERLTYYFEVWDNDAVNGSKKAVSEAKHFYLPSKEEMKKMDDENFEKLKNRLDQSRKISEEIKKEVRQLKKDLVQNKTNSFDMNNKMKQIAEKHNKLEDLMKQMAEENKKNNELLKNLKQKNELVEKQKQIEKLMDSLLDDEMKKMLEEINKLMKEFDKDKFNKLSEEMEMSMEELSENLDQNLEQLKRFEVEKKIEQAIDDLKELAKEHDKLSEETKSKEKENSALQKKQEEHEKQLDEANKKLQEISEKNNQLKDPMKWDDLQKEMNDIKQQMQKESSNLGKGKNKKASQQQHQSAEKMKEVAQQMQSMLEQNQAEEQSEDMAALRQLLENLNSFSFDQEDLILQFRDISQRNPLYVKYANGQVKLNENYLLIKDSLNALAERQPMVAVPIRKEIKQINRQIKKAEGFIEEHKTNQLGQAQQMIMTSVNNLSLILAEALDQMKQAGKPSNCQKQGNCKKPGKGQPKPGFKPSKQQARSLRQQMKKMLEELKKGKGKSKGTGKGKPGKNGKKKMNAARGRMIAEHEKMQKMLNDLMNGNEISPQSQNKLKQAKQLSESVKDDLIRNSLSLETYKRQEMIMTRLLEAEKSEFERGKEEKRESKEGIDKRVNKSKQIFEKEKQQQDIRDVLSKQKFRLNPYYKDKYMQYMINIARQ